jgi:hypothetical protein
VVIISPWSELYRVTDPSLRCQHSCLQPPPPLTVCGGRLADRRLAAPGLQFGTRPKTLRELEQTGAGGWGGGCLVEHTFPRIILRMMIMTIQKAAA